MTRMTMVRATFRKASFELLACAFAGASRKNKTSGVGCSSLQKWRIAAVAEIVGQERSKEINPEIFKRAGVSRNPRRSRLRRRQRQFVSPFGSTAIIASLPLLASLRARTEPAILMRKPSRIIFWNPGASRPLASKTARDANSEGFFWRCS